MMKTLYVKKSYWQSHSQWVKNRYPEIGIFVLGILLRVTMSWRYQSTWGYDAPSHWEYIDWLLKKSTLPLLTDLRLAFHPPLYHTVIATLIKLGATPNGVIWLSIVCGIIRLGIVWCGLEWYIKKRSARIAALGLAAVLPASVQIDGMITNELMLCLFSVIAILLWPKALNSIGKCRWKFAIGLGILFGLGILTKVSAFVLLLALLIGVVLDFLMPLKPVYWQTRIKSIFPWVLMVAICLTIGGWFYIRNIPQYHSLFITSYEVPSAQTIPIIAQLTSPPLLDRRSLGFIFYWDTSIYRFPYYPSGIEPHGRFFPVIMASTFVDYYNYSFSGMDPNQKLDDKMQANSRPLTSRLVLLSRGAVLGGTVILLGSLFAWVICLYQTFRRDWGIFSVLLVPLLVVLFNLIYAIKYPFDSHGIIKSTYMQYGVIPLYAMFGLSVEWAFVKRIRWPILAVLLLSLGAVAVYTFCCRTGLFLSSV